MIQRYEGSQSFPWWAIVASLCVALPAATSAQVSAELCEPISIQGQYGPYDYRTDKDKLGVVEKYHFMPEVEALLRGSSSKSPGGDLDYTLRRFPNHHRALLAMTRFYERRMSPGSAVLLPAECYYERAIRWRKDDVVVRMMYAQFLNAAKRVPEAIRQLEVAIQLAGEHPWTHQNVGLVYLELGDYDRALAQAHRVIALGGGASLTKLADALKKAGKWIEPPKEEDAAAAAASAPSKSN